MMFQQMEKNPKISYPETVEKAFERVFKKNIQEKYSKKIFKKLFEKNFEENVEIFIKFEKNFRFEKKNLLFFTTNRIWTMKLRDFLAIWKQFPLPLVQFFTLMRSVRGIRS